MWEKILEKLGNFVSPKKWEPCYNEQFFYFWSGNLFLLLFATLG